MTPGPGDLLFLLDAHSFVHRDHHSSKGDDAVYNTNHRGEPIGALKRFMARCYWWRRKGVRDLYPTHFGAIFDAGRRNWRHDLYEGYKADRPATDLDLVRQMPLMRDAAEALGIRAVEQDGYEADDLIATYALSAVELGADVLILSGDKDLLQLIRPGITLWDPAVGVEGFAGYRPARFFSHDEVVEKFGVPPALVVDVQGLSGDPTDKIPGVKGIGGKTAAALVNEHGSLEGVIAAALDGTMKAGKTRERIVEQADMARLSRRLASLDSLVDYEIGMHEFALAPIDHARAAAFCEEHGLEAMLRQIDKDIEFESRRVA